MKLFATFVLFLLSVLLLKAQNSSVFKGKVLDKYTLEPIPFANIYINNTTIGTQSNEFGEFSLKVSSIQNIKLIVSSIGYKSAEKLINTSEISIELEPDNTQLAEIKVSSKKDKKWNSFYNDFEKVFLGSSEAAKFCKITNPWQIDIEKINNKILAKSILPIEIENRYLGYKLFWYLKSFESSSQSFSITGNSRFELLKAKNKREADFWNQNRNESFKGSLEHFLKSLYKGTSTTDGYKIYQETNLGKGKNRNPSFGNELNIKKTVQQINPSSLVICQNKKCYLKLENQIEVHFINKIENSPSYSDIPYQVSWLEGPEKMVAFDSLGNPDNQMQILTSGSMNAGRVAELLPLDFQLNNSEIQVKPKKFWQESVKLHTQKAYYYKGERIWIKAIMNYENQTFRDSLSKILHVDIINPQNQIIINQQWEIYNGEANGDVLLPDSLQTGIYYLRAYTNWMRNYGDSTIYFKALPILKSNQRIQLPNSINISNEQIAVSLDKSIISIGDSLGISIEGLPYHSYSVVVLGEKSITSIDTNTAQFSPKNLTEIKFPVEKQFSIKGITKDNKNKSVLSKITIIEVMSNKLSEIETDKYGNFAFDNIWGIDTLKYLMKATDLKGKKIRKIDIYEKSKPAVEIPNLPKIEIVDLNKSEFIGNEIINNENATLLNTVTVKAKKDDYNLLDKSKLYSRPDYVVKAADFQNKVADENLITFLRGRVPGLNIETVFDPLILSKKIYKIRVRGRSGMDISSNLSDYEPLVLLDGLPTSVDILETLNASQIDRIEVITRVEAMFGSRGANGVIAIYSLKSSLQSKNSSKNGSYSDFQQINIQGISQPNIFIQNPKSQSTLYWNPFVFTDHAGKATFKINTGNIAQNRIIQVFGIDIYGKATLVQNRFTVGSL